MNLNNHFPLSPHHNKASVPEARLPPLFEDHTDGTNPPVPFVIKSRDLHSLLQADNWRPLPRLGRFDTNLGRVVVEEDLLSAATFPDRQCMMVVLPGPYETEQNLPITPKQGRKFVSVLDVMNIIWRVTWTIEQYPTGSGGQWHSGERIQRASDGTWLWRGFSELKDETDVWSL